MITLRELEEAELDAASQVLWKSCYIAEKNETSLEGMTTFRDLVDPISLKMNACTGEVTFFGAFDKDLIAVGALKQKKHLLLLYVLPERQGEGVGTALLRCLLSHMTGGRITVNAAPGALSFYQKHGFVATAPQQERDGIRFIPMERTGNQ